MAGPSQQLRVARNFIESIVCERDDSDGSSRNFDTTALSGIRDIELEAGSCRCMLPVEQHVCNRYGTLHGGCIATLVDTIGTAALVTVCELSGVSLSISVNYLSPMPGGEEVAVSARVLKVGATIATIAVELIRCSTGALVATGTHVKFLNRQSALASKL